MAVTPRTTAPLAFYSGGKDGSRRDRRSGAKFQAMEKDYSDLNERLLSLTQRIEFLETEFKKFTSSRNDLISNKISVLEQSINEFDRLLMERNEQQLSDSAKPPKKRRKIPNELSVRSDTLTCTI